LINDNIEASNAVVRQKLDLVSHKTLIIAILLVGFGLGFLGRAVVIQNAGVSDMTSWKALAVKANERGVENVYRGGGAVYQGRAYSITYPPGSVYVLYATGRVYSWIFGADFPDRPAFNVFLRLPTHAAELFIVLLIFGYAYYRRGWSLAKAGAVGLAFWLNPAVILNTSVLGYTDAWFAACALAALICLIEKKPEVAAIFYLSAIFLKPQPLFLAPLIAIWVWRKFGLRRVLTTGAAGVATFIILDLPYILSGRWLTPITVITEATSGGSISAQQNNFWWLLLSWTQLERYMVKFDAGFGDALLNVVVRVRTDYVNSYTLLFDFLPLQTVGLSLAAIFLIAVCWRVWSRPEPELLLAGAALTIFGYTQLSVQAHENHLFAFLPFFVLLIAQNWKALALYAGVSFTFFFNLFMFEGLGGGNLPLDRRFLGLDFTLLNSLLNIGLFGWACYLFFSLKLFKERQKDSQM
jgi:hypothetical protein